MKVVVLASGERELRAAHTLAAEPSVETVALWQRDPSPSWHSPIVRTDALDGWDVVVGADEAAIELAATHHLVAVIANEAGEGRVVLGASPVGLGRALARRLAQPARITITVPGEPLSRGDAARFPPPLGPLRSRPGATLHEAPTDGEWAGVLVEAAGASAAVVDDAKFLNSVTLAAGVALAVGVEGPTPVWERHEEYLQAIERMGLVAGERTR